MRNNRTSHRKALYHVAGSEQKATLRESGYKLAEQLREQIRSLPYADHATYARDVALLTARAEQAILEQDESDMQLFVDAGQRGMWAIQAQVVNMARESARRAWRVYEDCEDRVRAERERE